MAGRDTLPATFETPSVWPHLRGRPVVVTTISVSLRLTTSVRVVVQASPLLSVTLIGVPRSWSLSGSAATRSPSSTAPQPRSSWQGVHPAIGDFCESGVRSSSGSAAAARVSLSELLPPGHDAVRDDVAAVADALEFDHKYTSGVIAWAPEDRPSDERWDAIVNDRLAQLVTDFARQHEQHAATLQAQLQQQAEQVELLTEQHAQHHRELQDARRGVGAGLTRIQQHIEKMRESYGPSR